ncbi:glycosyl hydrolase family 28-related protein [Paenibacillus segetis]|uniref:Rhamnogalacturonase A/B/Epimerase-like pectate lyase domain-containing protein n=1 Tax=Paenibacillus segetis TaxID=1325360 RepID=A0ABQ1YPI4_9BACL|nr:glycosyl hydrolase family 28-related protein [Paenibacillus segetis]GGH32234.1 hypothetical protein GCM10008013_36510 [Paenibacillus segetis]
MKPTVNIKFFSLFMVTTILCGFIFSFPVKTSWAKENDTPFSVNVKKQGAKGDGVSNDTDSFLQALELVAKHPVGGQVIVPTGTYLIDLAEPLYVNSNVQIIGTGSPTLSFKNLSGKEEFGYEAFWVTGNNITIKGIVIEGNNKLIRGIGVHNGAQNITITNCTIKNFTQPADTQSPHYNAIVSGILIYGKTIGITISNSIITGISAIHQTTPVARGIMIWSEPDQPYAKEVQINGNTISYISPREDADGIYFDKAPSGSILSNSIIEGNSFHHVGKRAIKIRAAGVSIKNNHITNSYNGNNPYTFYPIDNFIPQDMFSAISVYASHVSVTGNTIDGVGSYYSAIEADMGTLTDIVIDNNKISNGVNSNISDTNGIRLGDIRNFVISNNIIKNMRSGIFSPISSIQHGSISRNTISNVEFGILFLAPTLSYTESKVKVQNNTISAHQDKIISIPNLD